MRRAYLLFNKFSNHLLSCFGQVLTCQLVATWSVNIYIRTHLIGYTIQRKLAFQTQTQRMVSQKKKRCGFQNLGITVALHLWITIIEDHGFCTVHPPSFLVFE